MLVAGIGSGDAVVALDRDLVRKEPEPPNVSDGVPAAAAAAADNDNDGKTSSSQSSADAAGEHTLSSSSSSVAMGLSSGQFDVFNVKLLRTCSEPDLSRLGQPQLAAGLVTSHRKSLIVPDSRLTTGNCSDDFSPHAVSCSWIQYSLQDNCTTVTLYYTSSVCILKKFCKRLVAV